MKIRIFSSNVEKKKKGGGSGLDTVADPPLEQSSDRDTQEHRARGTGCGSGQAAGKQGALTLILGSRPGGGGGWEGEKRGQGRGSGGFHRTPCTPDTLAHRTGLTCLSKCRCRFGGAWESPFLPDSQLLLGHVSTL